MRLMVKVCLLWSICFSLSGQQLSEKEAKEDIAFARKILEEVHPGLFRYSQPEEWERAVKETLDFNGDISQVALNYRLRKLISQIHCGHTASYLPRESRMARINSETIRVVPFMFDYSALEATLLWSLDEGLQKGDKLLTINGMSIDSLYKEWQPYLFQSDGYSGQRSLHFFNDDFPFLLWDFTETQENYSLRFVRDGEVMDLTVNAISAKAWRAKRKSYRNSIQQSWFNRAVSESGKTAYMRIRLFGNYVLENGEKGRFNKFLKESFEEFKSKSVESLIIDLRDNDGGEGKLGARLYSYLAQEPFRYFKSWETKVNNIPYEKNTNLGKLEKIAIKRILKKNLRPDGGGFTVTKWFNTLSSIEPDQDRFDGKVFILTNGNTFSAASDFSAIAQSQGRATIIGQETGGAYEGNNSGIMISYLLPNSDLRLQVPLAKGLNNVEPREKGRGVVPDIPEKAPMIPKEVLHWFEERGF